MKQLTIKKKITLWYTGIIAVVLGTILVLVLLFVDKVGISATEEEISASVLGGGVALPHGMANLVIKPAVVIMKCAQRTEWQDGCVDIVFLLALNFQDIQSTRAFFSSFYEMTMEKNTTFLIRKAETEEEIMDVIMNSMNETEE